MSVVSSVLAVMHINETWGSLKGISIFLWFEFAMNICLSKFKVTPYSFKISIPNVS